MPPRIRWISRYGNGVAALLFAFLFLFALLNGQFLVASICAVVSALAAFNLYVAETTSAITAEEDWLTAEIRKAELRRRLASFGGQTPETVGRQHGL
jgi:hypothetical protein